jgi:hypothetical protein
MPSRERLASINLHSASLGVDKFSAELHLVDSCSSCRAADNHFLLAGHPASKPLAERPNPTRLPNLYEFPGKMVGKTEALLFLWQRESGRQFARDEQGNPCSPPRACSLAFRFHGNFDRAGPWF